LEIPIDHIGRQVICTHCSAEFLAVLSTEQTSRNARENLDERIDRLLADISTSSPKAQLDHHQYTPRLVKTYEV
jgi:hypothetical protein